MGLDPLTVERMSLASFYLRARVWNDMHKDPNETSAPTPTEYANMMKAYNGDGY